MIKKITGAVALVALVASCVSLSSQAADDKSKAATDKSKVPAKAADAKSSVPTDKSKTTDDKSKADANLPGDKSKVTIVFDHVLPNVPGKSMKGVLVEYEPGGSSPAHTHPKSAFIYATVLEGAIRSKVNNGPVKTYKAGENFSENPGDKHGVSENASKTKPAKLLAVFVLDTNEKELTTICK